ncbi:hypothetical protein FQZ97_1214720 [compost metagenome]
MQEHVIDQRLQRSGDVRLFARQDSDRTQGRDAAHSCNAQPEVLAASFECGQFEQAVDTYRIELHIGLDERTRLEADAKK